MEKIVEHLRKVHFTIISLTFLSFAFILSPKTSTLDKAFLEFETIEHLIKSGLLPANIPLSPNYNQKNEVNSLSEFKLTGNLSTRVDLPLKKLLTSDDLKEIKDTIDSYYSKYSNKLYVSNVSPIEDPVIFNDKLIDIFSKNRSNVNNKLTFDDKSIKGVLKKIRTLDKGNSTFTYHQILEDEGISPVAYFTHWTSSRKRPLIWRPPCARNERDKVISRSTDPKQQCYILRYFQSLEHTPSNFRGMERTFNYFFSKAYLELPEEHDLETVYVVNDNSGHTYKPFQDTKKLYLREVEPLSLKRAAGYNFSEHNTLLNRQMERVNVIDSAFPPQIPGFTADNFDITKGASSDRLKWRVRVAVKTRYKRWYFATSQVDRLLGTTNSVNEHYGRTFDKRFPNLTQLLRPIEEIELTKIRNFLESQKKIYPSQMSVFGASFSLSNFGIVLIFLLFLASIYFKLHWENFLRHNNNTAIKNLSETPWIGVYGQFWPRIIFIITISFLPAITGLTLLESTVNTGDKLLAGLGATANMGMCLVNLIGILSAKLDS